MKKTTETLLKQAAEYVAVTQPQLDRKEAADAEFAKRAAVAAGILANRGIMSKRDADITAQKVASNHLCAFDIIERLASLVGPEESGRPSEQKVASTPMDAFEALYLYDDPTMTEAKVPAQLD